MKNYYRIIESRNLYTLQVRQFPYLRWKTLLEGSQLDFIRGASEYYRKTFPKGNIYHIVE